MKALNRGARRVVLSKSTAYIVAARLQQEGGKPTRNEIAQMVCGRSSCPLFPCYECTGKANVIVAAYGERLEPPPAPAAQQDDPSAP